MAGELEAYRKQDSVRATHKNNRMPRAQRHAYGKNRKIILARDDECSLCGGYVDKSLKYPDPMSPSVDHIVPYSRGGHPSALDNLQLCHLACNITKADKMGPVRVKGNVVSDRALPQVIDLE